MGQHRTVSSWPLEQASWPRPPHGMGTQLRSHLVRGRVGVRGRVRVRARVGFRVRVRGRGRVRVGG